MDQVQQQRWLGSGDGSSSAAGVRTRHIVVERALVTTQTTASTRPPFVNDGIATTCTVAIIRQGVCTSVTELAKGLTLVQHRRIVLLLHNRSLYRDSVRPRGAVRLPAALCNDSQEISDSILSRTIDNGWVLFTTRHLEIVLKYTSTGGARRRFARVASWQAFGRRRTWILHLQIFVWPLEMGHATKAKAGCTLYKQYWMSHLYKRL